jgi:hypothetical protein
MKKKKVFLAIFLFSISLTIFGFIVDSNEFVLDLKANLADFFGMTALFFVFFSVVYLLIYYTLTRLFFK